MEKSFLLTKPNHRVSFLSLSHLCYFFSNNPFAYIINIRICSSVVVQCSVCIHRGNGIVPYSSDGSGSHVYMCSGSGIVVHVRYSRVYTYAHAVTGGVALKNNQTRRRTFGGGAGE